MPHALHSSTFKWDPKKPLLPIYKGLVEEKTTHKSPATPTTGTNSISLIAGAYGESSDENDDSDERSPDKPGKDSFSPRSLFQFAG